MPKNNHSLGIIPARFASTRFPGKPLVEINGKSMIMRVYEQAVKSSLNEVVVATDDKRIFEHIKSSNGRVVMTSPFHKTGTDRCAEVAAMQAFSSFDLIVNVQGDEPFIQPAQIDLVLTFMKNNTSFSVCALAKKISDHSKLFDPNTVKVVFDKYGKALYFSRSTIPFVKQVPNDEPGNALNVYKHVGIYGFRNSTLLEVTSLPSSPLEEAESLEQLRWMENGYSIGVQITDIETIGVDLPGDLERLTT